MAEPLTSFQEPGFFSQIKESPSLALLPGSVRVVGLIGTGKATRSVLQESLSREDAGTNHAELLANPAASIARVYSLSVFQYPISSYSTSITGSIAEGAGYAITGETLKVSVNGGATQTITFTGVNPLSLADVVTQVNAGLTGAKAYATAGNFLCLISGDGVTGDGGAKIKVLDGTANADLGFASNAVSNQINWKASMASTDSNVRPLDGEDYLIDYETPKTAADLKPASFFNLSQVSAKYGDPSNDNKVSLGAQGAFKGGASVVTIRQLDPEYSNLSAEMDAALKDLEAERINYLVPMVSDSSLWAKYLTHVSKMSSKLERKERRVLVSIDETSGRLALTGVTSWDTLMDTFVATSGLEPKRVQVLNPGYAKVTVKNAQIITDGCYNAAVLAGTMASPAVDTATPMTRKALASVDNLLAPDLLRSEKNFLTSIGVTVLEMKGALATVRRSITADSTSIAKQEPSIVDSLDQVASEVREALENRFTGTKTGKNTKAEVEAAAHTFLDRYVADEIIGDFRNITATQNSVEPRQFDITAEILPIFPFLWGTLDLTIVIS
jgi:hypothetical protein